MWHLLVNIVVSEVLYIFIRFIPNNIKSTCTICSFSLWPIATKFSYGEIFLKSLFWPFILIVKKRKPENFLGGGGLEGLFLLALLINSLLFFFGFGKEWKLKGKFFNLLSGLLSKPLGIFLLVNFSVLIISVATFLSSYFFFPFLSVQTTIWVCCHFGCVNLSIIPSLWHTDPVYLKVQTLLTT